MKININVNDKLIPSNNSHKLDHRIDWLERLKHAHDESGIEYAAFTDGKELQILMNAQDIQANKNNLRVEFGVNVAAKQITIAHMDEDINSKKDLQKFISCESYSHEQLDELNEKYDLKHQNLFFQTCIGRSGSRTNFKVALKTNDVCLITLK